MDIEHYLKNLKNITPRAEYVLRSRAEIVTTPRGRRFGWRQVLSGMAQSGSAIALMGLLLVFLAGGFSLMKIIGWDSQSIRVEAQAIDMQIQLADLKYTNFVSTSGNAALRPLGHGQKNPAATSTSPAAHATSTPSLGNCEATTTPAATSTPPPDIVGVDQALDALSR